MKWYLLLIIFSDGDQFHEEVEGVNARDALIKASSNWEDAIEITIL